MRIFIICPVRNIPYNEKKKIQSYVDKLEADGHRVHWPIRGDTKQDGDPTGLRICGDNRKAILLADEVHIWWTGKSEGSFFDFGMAFALQKKIVLANPSDIMPTPDKSFNNVLLTLHGINIKPYLLMLEVKKGESQKS